jgi:hypothetical protein
MNRKGRQSSFQHDLDDLDEFVPPHEIAASSYMDPTNVSFRQQPLGNVRGRSVLKAAVCAYLLGGMQSNAEVEMTCS